MTFDVVATAYDQFMGAWSSQLSRQLVDLAGVEVGGRVIDVGCGPGALTAELLTRLPPGDLFAIDPSESFVAAARSRHPGVDVRLAAAERIPFGDSSFDAALAQLVVHFMAEPVAGLREMARVTRPGGTVAASVWDYGGGRGPLGPFWEVARELDPAVVDESGLAGARAGHLVELLSAAGLREVIETTLTARRAFIGFEAWAEPFSRGVGPAGAYLASLAPEGRAEQLERCRARLPSGPFTLTAQAWAARGVV